MRHLKAYLLLFALFCSAYLSVAVSYAGTLRVNEIVNLKAVCKDGKITLTWNAKIVEDAGPAWGDTKVTIRRQVGMSAFQETVGTVEPPGKGEFEMSFVDTNIEMGKVYTYCVSSGTVSGARKKSITVEAKEGEVVTPENELEKSQQRQEKQLEENADWPERLAASIVMAIPNGIIKLLGLYDPLELVYGIDVKIEGSPEMPSLKSLAYWHMLTEQELDALGKFYDRVSEFVPIYLVLIVVLAGLGIMWSSANPESKLGFKEYLLGFMICVIILKFGVSVLTFVFDINHAVVKGFQYVAHEQLENPQGFLEEVYKANTQLLAKALLSLFAVFSVGIINWQYLMRKITIILLVGLLPIASVIAVVPSKRSIMGIWIKEFFSNVFLQSAHAAALALFFLLASTTTGAYGIWLKLAFLFGLPSISVMVRRIIGAEDFGGGGLVGSAGALLGIGSLFMLGRMFTGRKVPVPGLAGKSVPGSVSSGGFSAGNVLGAGARFGGALAAGMVGGMTAGVLTGNPAMGLAGGVALGKMGAGLGNTVSSLAQFAGTARKEGLLSASGLLDSSQLFEPAAAYGVGQKMFGPGLLGKGAGAALAAGAQAVRAFDGLISFGKPRPNIARQVGEIVSSRQEVLSSGMQNLETLKAERDMARLNLEGAEASYRLAVKDLEDYKKAYGDREKLETGKIVAEGNFVDALYEYEKAPSRASQQQMVSRYEQLMEQKKRLETYGLKEQEIAKKQAEREQAQMARDKAVVDYFRQAAEVHNLRKGLSEEAIREEFKKLRSGGGAPGNISVKWR